MSKINYMAVSGVQGIDGSLHWLDFDGDGFVLDAGMDVQNPGQSVAKIDLVPAAPHAALITHAHMDHVGALPELILRFPKTRVYMTYPSIALSEKMLLHSLRLREKKALSDDDKPIYSMDDLDMMFYMFQAMPLKKKFRVHVDPEPPVDISFWDAGHILGSAGVLLQKGRRSVFYSGNFKLSGQSILKGARFPKQPVDTLILESTYGADEATPSYDEEKKRFADFLSERLSVNGVVLAPVFALGRTQEVLMTVGMLKRRGTIPNVPVYITGMGTRFTKIYDRLINYYERRYPDIKLRPMAEHMMHRQKIKGPAIILATSGMMLPQTFSYELAQNFMDDPKNGIAFVGYVSPESPGHALREKALQQFGANGTGTMLSGCKLASFNFSAHASRTELLQLAAQMQPRTVILFHGEAEAYDSLQRGLREKLPGTKVLLPEEGKMYAL